MCNRLLQSIWHVGENINKQKIQILYVPQYSEKKMYYEMNKICKLKTLFSKKEFVARLQIQEEKKGKPI